MAVGICKNGKTLQILDLNYSDTYLAYPNSTVIRLDDIVPNSNIQLIIKRCQELKEVHLAYNNERRGPTDDDLEFLAKNISPNLEKLNLSTSDVSDDQVKILVSRCKKIKVLILAETNVTRDSLKSIRQYLNLTLEELSLAYCGLHPFTSFLELKSMSRVKVLNLHNTKDDIQKLREKIRTLPDWENLKRKHNLT